MVLMHSLGKETFMFYLSILFFYERKVVDRVISELVGEMDAKFSQC